MGRAPEPRSRRTWPITCMFKKSFLRMWRLSSLAASASWPNCRPTVNGEAAVPAVAPSVDVTVALSAVAEGIVNGTVTVTCRRSGRHRKVAGCAGPLSGVRTAGTRGGDTSGTGTRGRSRRPARS